MVLSLHKRLALVLSCLGGALAAAPAAGQQPVAPDTLREGVVRTTRTNSVGPLLDAPINRATYALGPGDVVDVAVFGAASLLYTLSVTPEGTLVIPEVGVARVLGLNLDQAQSRVRGLVNALYRDVDVTVTLSQVRSFKVFVLGDVSNPGVREANSATRVSEVVNLNPRGGTVRLRRNVVLRRTSGDTVPVDLARFALLGDLSANPTLREGDALVVPSVEETVTVNGRVEFPGVYEFRPGETLADLIRIVNGGRGFPPAAADSIRVSRIRGPGARETLTLSTADALGARGAAVRLRPFDAVFVPAIANYGTQYVATVEGQVARPGTYPIRPDTTTLRELIAMAGGFTPRASLVSTTLRRQGGIGAQGRPQSSEDVAPDSVLTQTERDIISIAQRSDASFVVVDFQRLFAAGGDPFDQPVRPGDLVNVPERRYDVAVLGAVGRPGLVPYASARSVDQYVRLAGGYSRRADWRDATVIRGSTGSRVVAREARVLEPGDQIVVPFRERRTFLQRIQTTQAVVAILSGALLTVASLNSIF